MWKQNYKNPIRIIKMANRKCNGELRGQVFNSDGEGQASLAVHKMAVSFGHLVASPFDILAMNLNWAMLLYS